mgnify:FL=1
MDAHTGTKTCFPKRNIWHDNNIISQQSTNDDDDDEHNYNHSLSFD